MNPNQKEALKQRILNEMCIDSEEDWRLAKEIYEENKNRLKAGIGLSNIYCRIKDLKKNPNPQVQ